MSTLEDGLSLETFDGPIGDPEQVRRLVTPIPGPESLAHRARSDKALPAGLGTALPVFIERAGGGVMVDVDGNHLIDLASGIAVTSVGAAAPRVIARVIEQVQKFSHTCFLVTGYESYLELAERLNDITPGDHPKRTILFSTGAEAVENAIKVARAATGRRNVVVFDNAFHGRTYLTMAMTAKEVPYKAGFGPLSEDVYRAPFAHALRFEGTPEQCTAAALEGLSTLLADIGPDTVAAIVIEPVQGEGGFIVPTLGFLPGVAEIAREHGIVFVADEIQSGMGRTGKMFASEHEGLVPDLILTAKALGGGLPLSAVTGRADLMDAVPAGGLGGTYSGNPLACSAALAVLDTLAEDHLVERAAGLEAFMRSRLEPLLTSTDVVAEVRGRGAMLALEFVRPGSLEPHQDLARQIAQRCHAAGVLVLLCGMHGNVIRLLPPLVIGDDLLDEGLGVLVDAVRELSATP